MAEVRVEHVWKFYQGEKGAAQRVEAVKDATFTCNDKEFCVFLVLLDVVKRAPYA